MKQSFLFLVCTLLLPFSLWSQDFSGTFQANSEIGSFLLTLEQSHPGKYDGSLIGEGGFFTLEGSVDAAAAIFSLSGQLGGLTVSVEGLIVDDDSNLAQGLTILLAGSLLHLLEL